MGDHTGSSVPVTAEGAGALLFYGYYDQTDLFFKMAKTLSINTSQLDSALVYKRSIDIPYFTPATQLRVGGNEVQMLPNAPLFQPRSIENEHICGDGHEDDH